jgi:surfeit locus 1 family protein
VAQQQDKSFFSRTWLATSLTVLGVSLLLFLGTWQLQRLQWKINLIQTIEKRFKEPEIDFNTLKAKARDRYKEHEFQKIYLEGHYLHQKELKWMSKSKDGKIGVHLVTPFLLKNGLFIIVDRGWVPLNAVNEASRPGGRVIIHGYLRTESDQNYFTPLNTYHLKEIYSIKPDEIAKAFNLVVLPFYMTLTSSSEKLEKKYPLAANFSFSLRNFHFQYAITWYALAVILITIYGLYLRRKM